MKKVLVVGGAGYIGGLTTDYLMKAGYKPTVFDNLLYETRFLKKCDFIFGDIRNTKKLIGIQNRFDEIIWLAAIVGDSACEQNPKLAIQVNFESVKRFLSKTKRRVVFTSTCSVYGIQDFLVDENSQTNPLSLYGKSKLKAEEYVLNNGGVVFRLGTLFGVGDEHSRIRFDLVINYLTMKAFRDKRITIYSGEQWRPVISVSDVANYLVESCQSDVSGIFNLKYKNIQIKSLTKIITKVFLNIRVSTESKSVKDLRNYRVTSKKSEEAFKFKPNISIEKEVKKIKKILKEGRIKNINDDIYYNTHYLKSLLYEESKTKNH